MQRALFTLVLLAALAIATNAAAKIPKKSINSCDAFSSYEEIGALLAGYAETYPEIAQFYSIGTSVGDRADTVLEIIEWLMTGYGDDQLATDLIDGTELLFVPLLNPDGYVSEPASRENANGVDLNRNLGFAWHGGGAFPFSEPETTALRDASQAASFDLGLSYHTVAPYVNGPWNYTPHYPLDEDLCQAVGDAYAGSSSYNVVFGWDWYGINGDVNDWSLGTQGTFDWTIEMISDLNMQWGIHGPGVAAFLEWIFTGAEGIVTDAETGDPLFARIQIDPAGEPVFTDPDVGDFHRILLPGTYDITAVANGYEPATALGVVVPDGDTVSVDFELVPGDDYSALQVNRMILPEAIPNAVYEFIEYQNHTRPADALGLEDGVFYAVSPGGSITVDLGPGTEAIDGEGADLLVLSGTGSDDPGRRRPRAGAVRARAGRRQRPVQRRRGRLRSRRGDQPQSAADHRRGHRHRFRHRHRLRLGLRLGFRFGQRCRHRHRHRRRPADEPEQLRLRLQPGPPRFLQPAVTAAVELPC
jgi:hypothetical protein